MSTELSFGYCFGSPVVGWWDSIRPITAKVNSTLEARGELIIYLKSLNTMISKGFGAVSRGLFIHSKGFDIYVVENDSVLNHDEFFYTANGSEDVLRQFFSYRSPWEKTALEFFSQLKVEPLKALGCGGTGRVIHVKSVVDGQSYALKIVASDNFGNLMSEHTRITNFISANNPAFDMLPTFISAFKAVNVATEYGNQVFGAILTQPVGEPVDSETLNSQSGFFTIVQSLASLHKLNVVHGDARMANLIQVNGKFVWIDLRGVEDGKSSTTDMNCFLKDLTGSSVDFDHLVRKYNPQDDQWIAQEFRVWSDAVFALVHRDIVGIASHLVCFLVE